MHMSWPGSGTAGEVLGRERGTRLLPAGRLHAAIRCDPRARESFRRNHVPVPMQCGISPVAGSKSERRGARRPGCQANSQAALWPGKGSEAGLG